MTLPNANDSADATLQETETDRLPCGIIMPISATKLHSAEHWGSVRKLLSRAIERAGFTPTPVWENSSTDRVSERIIGNIFAHPVVVADISDENANVMLELGLRLASRKPTIVVVTEGVPIPFDIRDFHALMYPASLSILEMEDFIDALSKLIKDKHEAASKDGYEPFLSRVVVDVVEPSERQVPLDRFVLDRLDEISGRIARLEVQPDRNRTDNQKRKIVRSATNTLGTAVFFSVPGKHRASTSISFSVENSKWEVQTIAAFGDNTYYAVVNKDAVRTPDARDFIGSVEVIVNELGGTVGAPSEVADNALIF